MTSWRRLFVLSLVSCAGACSLIRDLDGFADTGERSDAADGGAANDANNESGESEGGACRLEQIWAGGNANPGVGPYLHAIGMSQDAIYLVGGRYPGGAMPDDTGFVRRIVKDKVAAGKNISSTLDQPVAIVVKPDGSGYLAEEHGARLWTITPSPSGPSLALVPSAPSTPYKDLAFDPLGNLWTISGGAANTGFGPLGGIKTTHVGANRVIVNERFALLSRVGVDAGAGLTVYALSDAGAPASPVCDREPTSVRVLDGDGTNMAWGGEFGAYVAPFGSCEQRTALTSERVFGIAVDARYVLLRLLSEVRLYTLAGALVCATPLDVPNEVPANGRVNTTALLAAQAAYFITPARAYRLWLPSP